MLREPLAHREIHSHGFIRLDDVLPSDGQGDLNVVRAARVSFDSEPTEIGDREKGLIRFCMRNGHGSIFEHVVFQFRLRVFIAVEREWFRHRMASYNSESGRYSQYKPEWYVPDVDHVRQQTGKPGAYTFEPLPGGEAAANEVRIIMDNAMRQMFETYGKLQDLGVAKELARMVLPVAQYSSFMWTVNLRSLLNFLMLRNEKNAMREIREYAKVIEEIATPIVPTVMEAFNEYGRVAP